MPQDLKAALLEHGRTFAECKRHDTLLDYCLFALSTVDGMPVWDAEAHNKVREGGSISTWCALRPGAGGLRAEWP